MHLGPHWKIKRELKRIQKKIISIHSRVYVSLLSAPRYDMLKGRSVQIFDGKIPYADRIAIYLIFPKNGISQSHKLAIEYLRTSGYSPFVVSNLPLTDSDCAWLTQNTYKFLSRPNIGYDFGGYREGVLSLYSELNRLQYLAFFNDSTWFPTQGSKDWLSQAEALNVAYVSPASSFGTPRIKFFDFRTMEWRLDVTLRYFHYCSYALLVRKEILRSKAFWRYWKFLPLTADKSQVVRVGEIGLTRLVIRKGYSHGSTLDLNALPTVLATCSNLEINKIARNLITIGNTEATQLVEEVVSMLDAQRSASERQDLIKLILTVASRIGASYVLPEFLHENFGFSFLKKSPLVFSKRDSEIMMKLGKKLKGPSGRIIEHEMHSIFTSMGNEYNTAMPHDHENT